jgi:hypothetical protein
VPKSESTSLIHSPRWLGEQQSRHFKAERSDGLQVDHQFELGWCLHRKVGGLVPFGIRSMNDADRRKRSSVSTPYESRPPCATKNRKGSIAGKRCRAAGATINSRWPDVKRSGTMIQPMWPLAPSRLPTWANYHPKEKCDDQSMERGSRVHSANRSSGTGEFLLPSRRPRNSTARDYQFQCYKLDRRSAAILVNHLHSFTWEILAIPPGLPAGLFVVAWPAHSSRFSLRFPQCRSFDESYSGIGFAPCRASIIPT